MDVELFWNVGDGIVELYRQKVCSDDNPGHSINGTKGCNGCEMGSNGRVRIDCTIVKFVVPLYTGATRGKSPTWLDWPSPTGQIMENRNPGRSRKNGASPIRLIIRRLLWMISNDKDPFRHERAHDDFVVLWLLINQKEVIKECVYMCQMVAQFGTR